MAVSFAFRNLISNPVISLDDPLTLANASPGAGSFGGIDAPRRAHLVGSDTLSPTRQAAYVALALTAGQEVRLDVDFTPGNLRLYVLDSEGNIVAQNGDSGVTDIGSPGTLDPHLTFAPPASGVFFFVVTSFDNEYLGNWQFENDGSVTGSFQLDISAPRLPLVEVLSNNSDDFFGSSGTAYRIRGRDGDDRIWLFGTNDDAVNGGGGGDDLDGGPGNDALVGGGGNDIIKGGLGNDVLSGGRGVDVLEGGDGDDELHGGRGGDVLNGGNGNDRIFSGLGDVVQGGAGNDTLIGGGDLDGGADDDLLIGNDRDNLLTGGTGNDTIFGMGGDDTIIAGEGDDEIDGGGGKDTIIFDATGPGITLDLAGGTSAESGAVTEDGSASGQGNDSIKGIERAIGTNANDEMLGDSRSNTFIGLGGADNLSGADGNDRLFGDDGNDGLFGGNGNDWLEGNDGHDDLYGGRGLDRLFGGSGDDDLIGGKGKDTLTGGEGNDLFIFTSVLDAGLPGGNLDVITDFTRAHGDKISLSQIDADELAPSNQAFHFIGNTGFTGVAGELRYFFDDGGNTIIEGDNNGDGNADFGIILTGQITLASSDFFL